MGKAVGGAVVIVLALAVAGCGGDDDGAERVTSPAEAPDNRDASPTAQADQRRAEAALLTLDDFPVGWTATDDEDSESACTELRDARAGANARASSPTFAEDNDVGAEHGVWVYSSEVEARRQFAAVTSASATGCLGEDLADTFAEKVEASTVEFQDPTTSQLRIEPVGSESAAIRVAVPYTSEVVEGEVIVDIVFVQVGRGLSLFAIQSDLGSPDDEQRDQLVGVAARRLNRELD